MHKILYIMVHLLIEWQNPIPCLKNLYKTMSSVVLLRNATFTFCNVQNLEKYPGRKLDITVQSVAS